MSNGASANSITTAAASYTTNKSVVSQEWTPRDVEFNRDGTKMFVIGDGALYVNEYTLSTGWDLSSTVTYVTRFYIGDRENEPTGLSFNNDGTKMYVNGWRGQDVNEYTLSTGWDLSSTVTFVDATSMGGSDPRDVEWNSDGTKMYIMNRGNDTLYQYQLTTAFDLSLIHI